MVVALPPPASAVTSAAASTGAGILTKESFARSVIEGIHQMRKEFGGRREYLNAWSKIQEQRMDFSKRLFAKRPMSNVVEYATNAASPSVTEETLGTTRPVALHLCSFSFAPQAPANMPPGESFTTQFV